MATSEAKIMSEFTNPNLEILLSADELQSKIRELGAEIARDYADRNALLLAVLKGACTFLSDLMRAAGIPLGAGCIAFCSYGYAMRPWGGMRLLRDLPVQV